MLAAGAAALERGLRLRGAGLGLAAAAAAAAAAVAVVVVVPLVGEVEVGFEDFGARFLTLSMRWRIALGVQSGRVLDGVRWGGEWAVEEWMSGEEERLWKAGGVGEAGWEMRTGTHNFSESVE